MNNIKSVLAIVNIQNDQDYDLETIIHYGRQRHSEFHVIGVEQNEYYHSEIVTAPEPMAAALVALNEGKSADCLGRDLASAMNSLSEQDGWDKKSQMDAIVALVKTILQQNIDDQHELLTAISNEVEAEFMLPYYYKDDVTDYVERKLRDPLLKNADDGVIVEEAINRDIDLTFVFGDVEAKNKQTIAGAWAPEVYAMVERKGREMGYLKLLEALEQL